MKKILFWALSLTLLMGVAGCATNKVAKSKEKTFVMPCSEYVKPEGALSAWASGTSDDQSTARKKAMAAASAQIAAQIAKTVETTTEDYAAALKDADSNISKSLLIEKSKILVSQTIKGATIVCDQWHKADDGKYTNYIVMELQGTDFLEMIYQTLTKQENEAFNKALLEKIFLENLK